MNLLLTGIRKWHEARLAAKQLRRMPDYLLRDIGITRDQIDDYVHGDLTLEEAGGRRQAGQAALPVGGRAMEGRCCAV